MELEAASWLVNSAGDDFAVLNAALGESAAGARPAFSAPIALPSSTVTVMTPVLGGVSGATLAASTALESAASPLDADNTA